MKQLHGFARLLAALGLLPILAGCAFLNINSQVSLARNSTILSGMVTLTAPADGPVVVLAYGRVLGSVMVAHYAVLDAPGSYELMVGGGDYYLFAFIDRNRNLRFDLDEMAAGYGRPDLVTVRDTGIISDLDITVSADRRTRVDFPVGVSVADRRPDPFHSSLAGTIFQFGDPLYSLKAAEQGYMAPVDFFRSMGGNIYFLSPYDPARIPVLFVHGAMGSPENFRTMVGELDQKRYQPWFYYYPSGAGLDAMANLLSKKIDDLQHMYGFTQLHIIAHSMGGLVSRQFLINQGRQDPWLRSFITICTSWGGVEDAASGVAVSPFVLSSWRDIARGSAFIDAVYAKKLPAELAFYLFFGFRGDRVPWKAYNDGTITLRSQLDPRAQAEAKGTFGFNETHTSILENHEVIQQIQTLLDHNSAAPGELPGAGLRLRLAGLDAANPPAPFLARLIHRDAVAAGALPSLNREESLFLDPLKTGEQELTVPAGSYQLGVIAWGYRATPARQELDLAVGASQALDIRFEPVNLLSIRLSSRMMADRPTLGLLQPGGEGLDSGLVVLEGQGVHRELLIDTADKRSFADHYLDYRDFYADGRLVFFDLAPGSYRISVSAQGYRAQTLQAEVSPGRPGPGYNLVLDKNLR